MSFHHSGLGCKSRKSRDAWSNRYGQTGLGVQNEAGQRITKFCQESTKVIANTFSQPHKRQLYIWPSPDRQYIILRLVIFLAAKKGEAKKTRSSL